MVQKTIKLRATRIFVKYFCIKLKTCKSLPANRESDLSPHTSVNVETWISHKIPIFEWCKYGNVSSFSCPQGKRPSIIWVVICNRWNATSLKRQSSWLHRRQKCRDCGHVVKPRGIIQLKIRSYGGSLTPIPFYAQLVEDKHESRFRGCPKGLEGSSPFLSTILKTTKH